MKKLEQTLAWLSQYKDGIQLLFAIPAVVAVVVTTIWGMWTWNDQRERELMKPIFEQHIKTTAEIFEIVGKMTTEKDQAKRSELSSRFWAIYYGSATLYFSTETFQSLMWTAQMVAKCIDGKPDPENKTSCDLLQMSTAPIADGARLDLSTRLIGDGLRGLTKIRAGIPRKLQE